MSIASMQSRVRPDKDYVFDICTYSCIAWTLQDYVDAARDGQFFNSVAVNLLRNADEEKSYLLYCS